jgi:hypothetical protein
MFEAALNAAHIHITHIGRYVILLLSSGSYVCVEAVLEAAHTRTPSQEWRVPRLDLD